MKHKEKKNNIKNDSGNIVANRINEDCTVRGDIKSISDIRIDGTVEGGVVCEAKVVIGVTGKIQGNISCVNLTVSGYVNGDIIVQDTLYLRKTSYIGPHAVRFNKIIIEDGAEVLCQLMPITDYSNQKSQNDQSEAKE